MRRLVWLTIATTLVVSGCASAALSPAASGLPSSLPPATEARPSSSSPPAGSPLKWPWEASTEVGDPTSRAAGGTDLYLAQGRYVATVTAYPPTPWHLGTPVVPFACTATVKLALKATYKDAFLELRVSYDPATDLGATPSRSAEFAVATGALHYVSFAFGCPFSLSIDRLLSPGSTG